MDLRRACAHGTAWTTALLDGALVGGWLATRELQDRPATRRGLRAALSGAFAAQAFGGELTWQVLVGPEHPAAATDRRALAQALAVATAATVVLSSVHRRVPLVLSHRGVRHPHRVFGLVVGVVYAACTLPVWRASASRRLATWQQAPERPQPSTGSLPPFARQLREAVGAAVEGSPVLELVDDAGVATSAGWGASVLAGVGQDRAQVWIWYDAAGDEVTVSGDLRERTWQVGDRTQQHACLGQVQQLLEQLAGPGLVPALAAARHRQDRSSRRRRTRRSPHR